MYVLTTYTCLTSFLEELKEIMYLSKVSKFDEMKHGVQIHLLLKYLFKT